MKSRETKNSDRPQLLVSAANYEELKDNPDLIAAGVEVVNAGELISEDRALLIKSPAQLRRDMISPAPIVPPWEM